MVLYKVKKSKINSVKKAIKYFIKEIRRKEPGTLFYRAFQKKDKTSFIHFMSFKNRKAEIKHANSPYCKKFVNILYPNCTKKPVFIDLKLVSKDK